MDVNARPEQAHCGPRFMAIPIGCSYYSQKHLHFPLFLSQFISFLFFFSKKKKRAIKFLLSLFKEIRKFQKLCYSVEHQASSLANRMQPGTGLLSFLLWTDRHFLWTDEKGEVHRKSCKHADSLNLLVTHAEGKVPSSSQRAWKNPVLG